MEQNGKYSSKTHWFVQNLLQKTFQFRKVIVMAKFLKQYNNML